MIQFRAQGKTSDLRLRCKDMKSQMHMMVIRLLESQHISRSFHFQQPL